MARILTRPLFRKGGLSKTPRPSYLGGGVTAIRPGYRGGGMRGIMSGIVPRRGYADGPTLKEIISGKKLQQPGKTIYDEDYIKKQYEKFQDKIYTGGISDVDLAYGMQIAPPIDVDDQALLEFIKTQPETAYDAFKKGQLPGSKKDYSSLQSKQAKEAKAAGIDLNLGTEVTTNGTKTNGTGTGNGAGLDTRSQFEKYFREYLPVIEEQLAPDSDAAARDKWLALAEWGRGFAAEPGGDLVGAAAKAGEKPLETLGKISAQERQAKQVPKMIALQAALDRMKAPTATEIGINAQRIDNIAKDITGRSSLSYETAYKVAEQLDDLRKSDSKLAGKFNKEMPSEPKEIAKIKGPKYFYTDEGNLKVVKDGEIYSLKEWQSQKEA